MKSKGSTDDAGGVRASPIGLRLPLTFLCLGFTMLLPIAASLVSRLTTPCDAQTSRAAAAFAPIFASQTALAWGLLLGSLGLGILGYRVLAHPEGSWSPGPRTAAILSALLFLPVLPYVLGSHEMASGFPPCDPAFLVMRTREVGNMLWMGVGLFMVQAYGILGLVAAKASRPRS